MEKKEGYPFVKFEESELRGKTSMLYAISGHEDRIIRKSFVRISGEKESAMSTIHEKVEYLRNRAVEFKKIIDRHGIAMAKTEYIVGKDEKTDKPAVFSVSERIDGQNLHEMPVLEKDLAKKIDRMYAKIISELVRSYFAYEYFWYDSGNEQFVYGKGKEDVIPEMYLVDIDPNILSWSSSDTMPEKREGMLWNRLDMILEEVEEVKKR